MTTTPYQAGAVPISGLPALPGIALSSFDELAIVDVDASETKKITAEAFLQAAIELLPPGAIDGNKISYTETPVVDPNSIADGSITAIKLADNSSGIYASEIPGAGEHVGQACILASGKLYFWTGSAWLGAISDNDDGIAAGDLLDNSSGIWVGAGTPPESDGSFIGQIAVTNDGQAWMWNGTEWYALTTDVPDKSITGAKMADNSTAVFYTEGNSNIQGEFVGQLAIDDAEGRAYAWTGQEWLSLTSPDSITGGVGDVIDISIDENKEITASLQDTANANEFLAGPIEGGGTVAYRTIDSSDLPLAEFGVPGAVSPGETLEITGGVLNLPARITSNLEEYHVVAYDEYGLVTDSARINDAISIPPATYTELGGVIVGDGLAVDADGILTVDFSSGDNALPPADDSTIGGVIIGGGLAVSDTGVISIDNSATPGTYTKVTIDAYGLVTTGASLTEGDLPGFDADKIVSGEIDPLRIGDYTIQRRHLADYSITFIQEVAPTLNVGAIGGLWLKESTGALSVFNGNRWVSVSGSGGTGGGTTDPTVGLRYGGVVDGTTGLITTVTTEGAAAGFTATTALAGLVTEDNVGIYFVVNPAGDQIQVLPGQATSVGDWVLASSIDAGWSWVDRSGGGGGLDPTTIELNQLADVQADAPIDGDCLIYNQTDGVYQTRKINLDEIGEVVLNSPTDNQVLQYSGGNWINADAPSGGVIATDAPNDGKQYARQNEGWSEIVQPEAPPAGSSIPIVSETPPTSPTDGDIWVRPSNLRQYVYVTDTGGSSQWASIMCC